MLRRLLFGVFLILLLARLAPCQNPTTPTLSRAAERYLSNVLEILEKHALHAGEIDWNDLRARTLTLASGAQSTSDTYPAIYYALTRLKESHSFLRPPDSLPEPEKQRAYANIRSVLLSRQDHAPRQTTSVFADRSVPAGHMIRVGDKSLAYIVVPRCWAKRSSLAANAQDFREYANALHGIAASLQDQNPLGWIVDLRGNGGGDMYPMVAGVGFVLGEGNLGYFDSGKTESEWFYRDGKAGSVVGGADSIGATVTAPPLRLPHLPPVAVLVDSGTASSGEAVAISFIGRPSTRLFGAHTFGLSTGNASYQLPDGAVLVLCESVEADRNHRRYPDGVEPDEVFAEPKERPEEQADSVLTAATRWLLSTSIQ